VAECPSLSAIHFEQRKSPSKSGISRTVGFLWWSTAVEHSLPPICQIRARFSTEKSRAISLEFSASLAATGIRITREPLILIAQDLAGTK